MEKRRNFIQKKEIFSYKQKKSWQLPIFAYTIVGVRVLNFCVRDGNRCTHSAIVTKKILEKLFSENIDIVFIKLLMGLNPRFISTGQLNMSPCFHLQPINLIVFEESYCINMGKLILKLASRLDAFSGYPFPT